MERVIYGINELQKKQKITNIQICGKTGTVENYKIELNK